MKKEFNHFEFDYNCIRVSVEYRDGNKVDFSS